MALVIAGALALGACGGAEPASDSNSAADTGSSADTVSSDAPTGNGPDVEGSVDDDDLLVPRDYLQGVWCDSDGSTWTIDGDTAQFEDTSGGKGEFPVDLVFVDNLDGGLISQTDAEFVIGNADDQMTFTRGSC